MGSQRYPQIPVFQWALPLFFIAALLPAWSLSLSDAAALGRAAYFIEDESYLLPPGFSLVKKTVDKASGFRGAIFRNGTASETVIVFAGTEFGKDPKDILADIGIVVGEVNDVVEKIVMLLAEKAKGVFSDVEPKRVERIQQKLQITKPREIDGQLQFARKLAREARQSPGGRTSTLFVVGHSLGGFLAQLVGFESRLPTITFNAPGAANYEGAGGMAARRDEIATAALEGVSDGLLSLEDELVGNHIRAHDLVGMFGDHIGPKVEYPDIEKSWGLDFLLENHSIDAFINFLEKARK